MKLLNSFPKPRVLTELTLLSKYEIIIYIIAFCTLGLIYYAINRIPVKDVYIDIARLDPKSLKRNNYCNDLLGIEYCNSCQINIHIPLTDYFSDSIPNYSYEYEANAFIEYDYNNESSYCDGSEKRWNETLIDSLSKIYLEKNNNRYPIDHLFYHKVRLVSNELRFFKQYDNEDTLYQDNNNIPLHSFHKRTSVSTHVFGFSTFLDKLAFSQNLGILSKPHIFDLHDISQCYYRIHINSQIVNHIKLNISFLGSNEVSFINETPDSLNNQNLYYEFLEHDPFNIIEKDVTIRVSSKDLIGKQSARIFFLTSVLSALITIFLAFFIIYVYRKFKYTFSKKNRRIIDKIVSHSKNKHKKYHSRKKVNKIHNKYDLY